MSSFFPTWNPGRSGVTMNAEMPRDLWASAIGVERAMTMITSAWLPVVTQLFVPVSTQSSPSRSARQVSDDASDPASGSLSANAPIFSPRAIGRRKRSFCSVVPKLSSICVGSELCTLINTAVDASATAISSSAIRYVTVSRPRPSHSSGIIIPRKPSAPRLSATPRSNSASRSHRAACGAISSSANCRASSTTARCCSVSGTSMNTPPDGRMSAPRVRECCPSQYS